MHRDYIEKASSPLGKPTKRVDAFVKVTGKAEYVEDIHYKFHNLLHIKVLRSPYAHAEILSIDTSKAEKIEGVQAVLTGKDCPRTYERSEVFSLPAEANATWAGQGIVAVAADTKQKAQEALKHIEVKYKELPFVIDVEEAMKPDPVAVVDPRLGKYPEGRHYEPIAPNIASYQQVRTGDIEKGFAEADIIVENKYYCSRVSHSQMERASCLVKPDSDGKGLTMWTNGCGVHLIKSLLCKLLKLESSRVQVIQMYQGGSFGNRLTFSAEPLCAVMAMKTGQPCEFTFSRDEMFTAAPSNWPVTVKIKTGATKEGILTAQEMTVIEDCGAHQNNVRDCRSTGSGAVPVYRVPNFYQNLYAVNTNTPPVGSMRGLGSPQMSFAVEQQINIIADKLGISQLEIRLKNIMDKGEKNAYGEKLLSTGAKKCIHAVADFIKMDETVKEKEEGPWRYGKGISVAGKQNTPQGRSEADVLVHSDGSLEVRISCDENGMGAETAMSQIVAHEFEVPIERVKVVRGKTAQTPYDMFSSSSRSTYTTGNAVRMACIDAKNQLRIAAAEMAGVVPDRVDILQGRADIAGGTIESINIEDLFYTFSMFEPQQNRRLRKGSPVIGHGVFAPAPAVKWDPMVGHTPRMWNWYQYNACGAEVAVNMETGQTKIMRIVSACDMGFPINPQMCEAQAHGGLTMASSFARNEEYLYNKNGQIINGNFADYRLSTILDMPPNKDVGCVLCPDPLPDGPYGAKGIAESVTCPVAPAIAEAIYNAAGIRPKTLPMSAERLLNMIETVRNEDD